MPKPELAPGGQPYHQTRKLKTDRKGARHLTSAAFKEDPHPEFHKPLEFNTLQPRNHHVDGGVEAISLPILIARYAAYTQSAKARWALLQCCVNGIAKMKR